jgi:hypothetical protein
MELFYAIYVNDALTSVILGQRLYLSTDNNYVKNDGAEVTQACLICTAQYSQVALLVLVRDESRDIVYESNCQPSHSFARSSGCPVFKMRFLELIRRRS